MLRRLTLAFVVILVSFIGMPAVHADSALTCPTSRPKLPAVKQGETVNAYVKRLFELSAPKTSDINKARLVYLLDPSANKAEITSIAKNVRSAELYWSRFQVLPSGTKVLIAKNPDFVRRNLSGQGLAQWKQVTADGVGEWMSHLQAGNVLLFYSPRGLPVTDKAYQQVGAHELFHYFQYLMSDGHDQKSARIPLWFLEGTGAAFSFYVTERNGFPNIRSEYVNRLRIFAQVTNGRPLPLEAFNDDRLMIYTNEKDSRRAQQIASAGELAGELFISKAGVEGLGSIFYCMRDGEPWDAHFKTLTGMTSAQFTKDANKYINEVFDGKERLMK